ncbi:putative glycolipid-binding domain-containing protein [Kribbella sp. CA-293567]|uniref:putative glycolipid-binding domain-containing protein n=1 Tax=Kribbella sp. CA-293567 TaxID=3002436 RepID=UPI0022DD8488|nr:putative glycolipid-binding domain-containing protein [Kribbella sp. CA-293567]WBQ04108.1 putative glycolipid-binding domain-containing protein [Kribbella sp. CA-293567]
MVLWSGDGAWTAEAAQLELRSDGAGHWQCTTSVDGEAYQSSESGVRFISLDGDFVADLQLDTDGLIVNYPGIAKRVG